MKTSQWNEERIIGLLQQAEEGEVTIAELCRTQGVSETGTLWVHSTSGVRPKGTRYGGLQVSEAKRLRELEQENSRLKKLLAESILDNALLKEVLQKK